MLWTGYATLRSSWMQWAPYISGVRIRVQKVKPKISELHIHLEWELESKKWNQRSVSFIYIWSENLSPKSEAKDGAIGRQFQFLSIVFVCAVCMACAEILYLDFDLKNNTLVSWTDNLISDMVRYGVKKNPEISWGN
jgi:hypothetical protein